MTSLYFTSHPSPNDRLSRFNSDKQELYSLLATLEKTFDDIQFGKNLDLAKSNLEKALSKFPGNTHLEKSYAICLHKIWMSTASNEDLKLNRLSICLLFGIQCYFQADFAKGSLCEQLLAIKPLIQKRKKLIKR